MYICIQTPYTYMHVYIHVCGFLYVCMYTCRHAWEYMSVCMYTNMHITDSIHESMDMDI